MRNLNVCGWEDGEREGLGCDVGEPWTHRDKLSSRDLLASIARSSFVDKRRLRRHQMSNTTTKTGREDIPHHSTRKARSVQGGCMDATRVQHGPSKDHRYAR